MNTYDVIAAVSLERDEFVALASLRRPGAMWRPKDRSDPRIPTSWSATLINYAGGLEALARDWEPET